MRSLYDRLIYTMGVPMVRWHLYIESGPWRPSWFCHKVFCRQSDRNMNMSPSLTFCALSMMTSSNGNIFHVTSPLCGEFTGPSEFPTQRPVTRSFNVFFDLRLNKPLSKQPWGWWFETLSRSLWRHRNDLPDILILQTGAQWWRKENYYVILSVIALLRREAPVLWHFKLDWHFKLEDRNDVRHQQTNGAFHML